LISDIRKVNKFAVSAEELEHLLKQRYGNESNALEEGLGLLKQLGKYFPKRFIRLEHLNWIFKNEENLLELRKIVDFFEEENGKPFRNSARVVLESQVRKNFYGPYDAAYFKMLESIYGFEIPPGLFPVWITYYSAECAMLRHENNQLSDIEIAFEAGAEIYHLSKQDLSNFYPDLGDIADIDNNSILRVIGVGLKAIAVPVEELPESGWYSSGAKKAIKGGNRFTIGKE